MKRDTGHDRAITRTWRPATRAVRGGTLRSDFGETSEAIFLTSGYCYDNAEEVAARFRGDRPGMTYSRLQNPTTAMLEEKLCLLEDAPACRTMASGMAAMTAALMSSLSAGDHLIAASAMFGSCRVIVDTILPRFGIETTVVDGRDLDAWARARRDNTKVFFFETPANPTLDIVDISGVSALARDIGALTIVDNAFSSPVIQKPLQHGADIVAYSATKSMDGQGRVLAGAVLGPQEWIEEKLLAFTRHTGPTLSAFNAWVVLKSLETLDLRVRRAAENALTIAQALQKYGMQVSYPGLPSHPQHDLAMSQMESGGAIVTITLPGGGRERAFAFLDALRLIDISNNIGDARSLMTHPASTTHASLSDETRQAMGIGDDLLRLSVGLEDPQDLIDDLVQAFERPGL